MTIQVKSSKVALAKEQLIAKTNIKRIIIVDNVFSEVRGVIFRENTLGPNSRMNNSGLMSDTSMNKGISRRSVGREEDVIEEGFCCCKKKKRAGNGNLNGGAKTERLLSNQ